MIRIIDGKPIVVPDDERITPELKELRGAMNVYLNHLVRFHHSPEGQALYKRFLEIRLSDEAGFEWYADPEPPKKPEP